MATIKALIVEDSPTMRQLLVYALKRIQGIQATEAGDGVEGLQKCDEDVPDIILTDINMPVMDGLKFIEQVRGRENLASVPIVVITTEGGDEDRERALGLGANAFVTKPIQAPAVVKVVMGLLNL
jgi:two-component system chemotaxis response regulator CheY